MAEENLWVPEQVTAMADGTRTEVLLARCLQCEAETFVVYLVGPHQWLHLQCTECDATFCAGHDACDHDAPETEQTFN